MIGILGGTFDPPHNAHLKIAEYCLKMIPLEKIIFMPCYLPVLKQKPQMSANHRLAMISAAIDKHVNFSIDEREIHRAQPSYTIDSLQSIRQEISKTISLGFIMGSDAFNQFLHWKDWQGILKCCHLIVVNRHREALNQDPALMQVLAQHKAQDSQELFKTPSGKILVCPMPGIDISSTALRETLHKNPQAAKDKLPLTVWKYIIKHRLY